MSERRRSRGSRRPRPAAWVYAVICAFVLYFAVLLYADLFQRSPTGLHIAFDEAGVLVAGVTAASPAARAGIVTGDRVLSYGGRRVQTRLDWIAVDANLTGGRIAIDVTRGDMAFATGIESSVQRRWESLDRKSLALWFARLVQALCLALGVLVAIRRPGNSLAGIAALLLASLAVFTIVVPFGFARYWRSLPAVLEWAMWLPFVCSMAGPMLFFLFSARFPRPLLGTRPWLVPLLCVPGALILAWHVAFGYVAVHLEARTLTGRDWMPLMVALTTAYCIGGLVMLVAQSRQRHEPAEQRRLRLLLAGAAVGALAAVLVETEFWLGSSSQLTSGLFNSPLTLAGVLLLLPFPLSLAYVVLRQRVFDLGSILRQGVRYALARRLLIGLVPVLALSLATDILLRRDQPIPALLQARGWLYVVLGSMLAVALLNRRQWLERLDRRFFRERHRAEQVLHHVAARLRRATDAAGAAAHVVDEVAAALQPVFAGALAHRAGSDAFDILAATPSFPREFAPAADWTLVGLARATGAALHLSPDHDTWITEHLAAGESRAVFDSEVELVVPVIAEAGSEVLLALGPKRSEEPYTRDDITLLEAIAASLGLLLDRAAASTTTAPPAHDEDDASLAECPECGACFDTGRARCPHDGVLLMVSDLPPVLAGRYRFEARIGAGGMGRVYRARDEALVRHVAVKVIGDHLVGSSDAAERFRREAQVAASFTHPNVVTVYDVGITRSGRAFLLMECLDGQTLRDALVQEGVIDAVRAARVIGDICHVLREAHSRRLVHRDLKPENVFLARAAGQEITKLLDFGIAKVLAGSSSVTAVGTHRDVLVGSLAYMSPEQLAGGATSPLWDLWALGVITCEMLTGTRPGAAASIAPPDADTVGVAASRQSPHVPGAPLAAFLAGVLADEPSARPQSADEFLERFTRATVSDADGARVAQAAATMRT